MEELRLSKVARSAGGALNHLLKKVFQDKSLKHVAKQAVTSSDQKQFTYIEHRNPNYSSFLLSI
jgi:hypothetical protein